MKNTCIVRLRKVWKVQTRKEDGLSCALFSVFQGDIDSYKVPQAVTPPKTEPLGQVALS